MVGNIVLNQGQEKAVKQIFMWWTLKKDDKYISVSGSAGTGKSTMLRFAIEKLDDIDIYSNVAYATPTGKAALVLNRKGLNAMTIHRLIYKPEDYFEPMLDDENKPIKDDNGKPKYIRKIRFVKRENLDENIKLIVIDEASMVNEKMWSDILSFNKRVILLSDHKQIPPVTGKLIDPVKNPDIVLTEIMRQGEDSDIVFAAERAASGELFKYELSKWTKDPHIWYDNKDVHFITQDKLTDRLLKGADIIICAKNSTRNDINNYVRKKIYKFNSSIPQKGDKLICRKNNWEIELPSNKDVFLINGLIGYVTDHIDKETYTSETFKFNFRPDFIQDDIFENIEGNINLFTGLDSKGKPLTKEKRDTIMKYGKGNKFEYGYCITTHLSQGSEWDTVIVFAEWMGDIEYMKKLIYTGITRAKKKLIVVRQLDPKETPFYK